MKNPHFTYIILVTVILASVLWSVFSYPPDIATASIMKTVLETQRGSYELQVLRDQVLISRVGDVTGRSWMSDSGLHIVDALVARRQAGADEELLVILGPDGSTYGTSFEILGVSTDGTLERRAYESMQEMNPWRLQTADVDGDGIQDISITMYKKTKFHPVMANRPFLYSWKEGRIAPLWRGSRLSRPFDDYVFSDLNRDGRDELIANEQLESGERVLQAYHWKGFGFEGLAQSIPYEKISSLRIDTETGKIMAQAETLGSEEGYTVTYMNEKLLLIKKD